MPNVILILALAHFLYGMPCPNRWLDLVFISVAIGRLSRHRTDPASVVNSMQESQLIVQLIYLPCCSEWRDISSLHVSAWLLVITQFVLRATW